MENPSITQKDILYNLCYLHFNESDLLRTSQK